jgi:hypothetical protein
VHTNRIPDLSKILFSEGEGRTRISLEASTMGQDLMVCIFNHAPHIGAVAVAEYDFEHQRASVSVVTRLGHKDDALAQTAAHEISKSILKPVCVIAGVHLDDITLVEINIIQKNTRILVKRFLKELKLTKIE